MSEPGPWARLRKEHRDADKEVCFYKRPERQRSAKPFCFSAPGPHRTGLRELPAQDSETLNSVSHEQEQGRGHSKAQEDRHPSAATPHLDWERSQAGGQDYGGALTCSHFLRPQEPVVGLLGLGRQTKPISAACWMCLLSRGACP